MQTEPQTEPPTPTSARLLRARHGALAALAALAGAALLSACGSSSSSSSSSGKTLDTARIALSIEDSILSERHIHAKVTCPASVPQEQGKTFTCIATSTTTTTTKGKKPTSVTTTTPFTVTEQNSKGYVTYHS